MRKIEAATILALIREHKVTHFGGAPIVHNLLLNAPAELWEGITHKVNGLHRRRRTAAGDDRGDGAPRGGAHPRLRPHRDLRPGHVMRAQEEWCALAPREAAERLGRQGIRFVIEEETRVLHSGTLEPVPWDGCTLGEVMFRGNMTMKGYLKNPRATAEAFAGGWFHSGDLAVVEPDGYIKLKDRKKDIIISGGENISSIEVEDALYRHPGVFAAAVVSQPDPVWGSCPVRSSNSSPALRRARPSSLSTAAQTSRTTRCPERSSSARCPRPPRARSRSTCCASEATRRRQSNDKGGNPARAADRRRSSPHAHAEQRRAVQPVVIHNDRSAPGGTRRGGRRRGDTRRRSRRTWARLLRGPRSQRDAHPCG